MSQAGRKLEPPRPLKSTLKQQQQTIQQSVPAAQQMVYYTPTFEVQTSKFFSFNNSPPNLIFKIKFTFQLTILFP